MTLSDSTLGNWWSWQKPVYDSQVPWAESRRTFCSWVGVARSLSLGLPVQAEMLFWRSAADSPSLRCAEAFLCDSSGATLTLKQSPSTAARQSSHASGVCGLSLSEARSCAQAWVVSLPTLRHVMTWKACREGTPCSMWRTESWQRRVEPPTSRPAARMALRMQARAGRRGSRASTGSHVQSSRSGTHTSRSPSTLSWGLTRPQSTNASGNTRSQRARLSTYLKESMHTFAHRSRRLRVSSEYCWPAASMVSVSRGRDIAARENGGDAR